VFVRWDDGATRRNIETTDGDVEKSDAEYSKWQGLPPRTIGRRQLVSIVVSNAAWNWRKRGRPDEVSRLAGIALRLDPDNASALLVRAYERDGLRPRELLLADVARARVLGGRCASNMSSCSHAFLLLDEPAPAAALDAA